MKKESKQQVVAEMHDKLQRANAVFLADFRGMNVGKATELRNELRKASVEYKVVKNTLLDLASRQTDKESLQPLFVGPTAVALSYDDPVAAAKVLSRFAKEQQATFKLKGGILTGKVDYGFRYPGPGGSSESRSPYRKTARYNAGTDDQFRRCSGCSARQFRSRTRCHQKSKTKLI